MLGVVSWGSLCVPVPMLILVWWDEMVTTMRHACSSDPAYIY